MIARTFIALRLPEPLIEALDRYISVLKKRNPSRSIKFVEAKNIHLTLHFLGYLNQEQIHQMKKILRVMVKKYRSFTLKTETIDAFPNRKRPRVIYVMITPHETLLSIHEELKKEIKNLHIETDSRPWKAHLTLARLKKPNIIIDKEPPALSFLVKSIDLMKSTLSRSGAQYSVLERFPLGV